MAPVFLLVNRAAAYRSLSTTFLPDAHLSRSGFCSGRILVEGIERVFHQGHPFHRCPAKFLGTIDQHWGCHYFNRGHRGCRGNGARSIATKPDQGTAHRATANLAGLTEVKSRWMP